MAIRNDWHKRVAGLLTDITLRRDEDMAKVINEHIEQWLLLPELVLAELAESKPEYELRVVQPIYPSHVLTKEGAEILTEWARELDPSLEVLPTSPIGYRVVEAP